MEMKKNGNEENFCSPKERKKKTIAQFNLITNWLIIYVLHFFFFFFIILMLKLNMFVLRMHRHKLLWKSSDEQNASQN